MTADFDGFEAVCAQPFVALMGVPRTLGWQSQTVA